MQRFVVHQPEELQTDVNGTSERKLSVAAAKYLCAAQIDPVQMTLNAPRDLPSFDASYQRHIGVTPCE